MTVHFPHLLREHRAHRRWSQERLGFEAGVSPRHLSCLETGKAHPSRDMVHQLAAVLDLDLRARNTLLVSAGFAASYPTTPLEGLPMAPVSRAIDLMLAKQEPYGAVLIDRCWNVRRVNAGAGRVLATFLDPASAPPHVVANLARATAHPEGLRPFIVNWTEVAPLLLERVERAHHAHPEDEERRALLHELRAYPDLAAHPGSPPSPSAPMAIVHLRRGPIELRLFTLLTTIGTPLDVTAQDLTVESFFPADDATDRWFRAGPPAGPGEPAG